MTEGPGEQVALVSVVANGGLAAAKLWGGLFVGSAALLADGLHSTLDVGSSGVAYLGIRQSRRPPDVDHRYGHHKFEYFAGAVITALLYVTGGIIVLEGLERLLAPVPLRATTLGLVIAAVSLVTNEALAVSKRRAADRENLFSIRADALHDHADAASSGVVFLGLALVELGFPAADGWAALGVAAVVFVIGASTGKEAFDVLVDKAPDAELLQEMDRRVRQVDGVHDAHALRARVVGETVFVDLHIQVDPAISVEEGHEIAHRAEDALVETIGGPAQVTVHVEPVGDEEEPHAPPLP